MKKLKFLLIIIFVQILFYSCSDEEVENNQILIDNNIIETNNEENTNSNIFIEENPYPTFINFTGYNDVLYPCYNNTTCNIGFKFKPLINGKINSIVIKLPSIINNLEVKIWDVTNNEVLRTEYLNIDIANHETIKLISPLNLVSGKNYAITTNTNSYYIRHETNWTQAMYPITCGNIKITSPLYSVGNSESIPTIGTGNFCNGDCSFNFLPTE